MFGITHKYQDINATDSIVILAVQYIPFLPDSRGDFVFNNMMLLHQIAFRGGSNIANAMQK